MSMYRSNYLNDFGKNRLQANSEVSLRLFKGLSLNSYGGASRIRDQLSLPKGSASLEEVLLRRRALATGHSFYGSIGLSYTFGSIYSNGLLSAPLAGLGVLCGGATTSSATASHTLWLWPSWRCWPRLDVADEGR